MIGRSGREDIGFLEPNAISMAHESGIFQEKCNGESLDKKCVREKKLSKLLTSGVPLNLNLVRRSSFS